MLITLNMSLKEMINSETNKLLRNIENLIYFIYSILKPIQGYQYNNNQEF